MQIVFFLQSLIQTCKKDVCIVGMAVFFTLIPNMPGLSLTMPDFLETEVQH